MAEQIRLDKYLGEMGVGTRSQMKEMAKKGRITVNGTPEKKTDRKVIPGQDVIAVDGSLVSYTSMEYYMLNKPQGVVSATEDVRFETVIDLIRDRQRKDYCQWNSGKENRPKGNSRPGCDCCRRKSGILYFHGILYAEQAPGSGFRHRGCPV